MMEFFVDFILAELAALFALLIVYLLLQILLALRKTVVVPSVTVNVSPAQVSRGDTVGISGAVQESGAPATSTPVALTVTDPDGNATPLPNSMTDANGNYTASYVVPSTAPSGVFTVAATALGTEVTTTFTLRSKHKYSES